MAVAVMNGPGGNSEDTSSGTFSITNRGNVNALDASLTGVAATGSSSYWGIWTNYSIGFGPGLTDPGTRMDGLEYIVHAKRSGSAGGIVDMQPVVGGTRVGSTSGAVTLSTSVVGYSFGGPTNLLGTGLTGGDINSGLGLAIRVSSFAPGYGQIDWIGMYIYYTTAAGSSLMLPCLLNGLGAGGPFFRNPLG